MTVGELLQILQDWPRKDDLVLKQYIDLAFFREVSEVQEATFAMDDEQNELFEVDPSKAGAFRALKLD